MQECHYWGHPGDGDFGDPLVPIRATTTRVGRLARHGKLDMVCHRTTGNSMKDGLHIEGAALKPL